ncbi:MAG TPA: hypothetical protein VFO14_07830 [Vicinamibacterales bacterium]|nr:hypothetical protein [Vicinamibacterales bacterium]
MLPLLADSPRGTARRPLASPLLPRRGARSCAAATPALPDEDGADGLEEDPIEPPPLIPPPLELLPLAVLPAGAPLLPDPPRGTADPVRSPPEEREPGPPERGFSWASAGAALSANAKATAPTVNL